MIEFSNLSGYQKYVVKSAMKDGEFIILACKCLIVCLTEFIKVRIINFYCLNIYEHTLDDINLFFNCKAL